MTRPTLLDIAKANGSDAAAGLIDEAAKVHPEIVIGEARTIQGINYKTLVRTAVPTGSSFRDANEGVAAVKGTYENRLVECFIFNKRWECDKAVADCYEDGPEAYIALEADAILEAGFQDLCTQFYYGTNATYGNAKGFPGLLQAYDSTNMVVDSGGTTDSVATSVWGVKFGPKAVQWVLGRNGEVALDDPRVESVLDSGGSNKFTAYVQELLMRPGLQVGSQRYVVRIKKVTTDATMGLTDAKLAAALGKFPAGIVPDIWLMNRRSLMQLQAARTAYSPTGAPALIPDQ
ncbi:MAG TPA: hypothetical protein VM431_08500, partial [Phycisphaerae bacterium]|nr:hypothetical protein [Phycisphaerae bacterium]